MTPARAATNSTLVLGIRPEAIRITPQGDHPAVVEEVELLGGETIVSLLSNGAKLNAKVDGAMVIGRGASVAWSVEPGDLHWFDAGTGKRV